MSTEAVGVSQPTGLKFWFDRIFVEPRNRLCVFGHYRVVARISEIFVRVLCRMCSPGASAREWFNVWSSGMWVCTATGSTAAMKAAGGQPMAPDSSDLQ